MEIAGFLKESFIDYPGKISSVVFTPNCSYRCPSCHANELLKTNNRVDEKEVLSYLSSKKGWIDGVVLCGGEPTMEKGLESFLHTIKEMGFDIKLDTNGNNPKVLNQLNNKNLLDYIAMDVKAPKHLYGQVTGRKNNTDIIIKNVENSMKFLSDSFNGNYEFRTTIVPVIKNGKIDYLNKKEIEDIATWIVQITGKDNHNYFLQAFVPRKGQLINSRLEEIAETPQEHMVELKKAVVKILPNVEIR